MPLVIATLIYLTFSLLATGAGTVVVFEIFTNKLRRKPLVMFLQCSLFASVTGGLSSFFHPQPTAGLSMLLVYVTGVPVLAWRKFHVAGVWRSIFAFGASIVFFLNIVVAFNLIFSQSRLSKSLPLAPFKSQLFGVQMAVLSLFVILGIVAAKRFRAAPCRVLHLR